MAFNTGDGVGTLPSTLAPGTGLVLTGTLPELLGTVVSVSRAPEYVLELADGRWAVLFGAGNLIELDRAGLAAPGLRVQWSPGWALDGADAYAATSAGFAAELNLDAGVFLDVPLGVLYAPGQSTPTLTLDAFAPEGVQYRALFAPQASLLRVGQMFVE